MGRLRQKDLDTDVLPITAQEVEQMFNSTTSQGPYPDAEDYTVIAELLTASILTYTSEIRLSREMKPALTAATTLQGLLEKLAAQRPIHPSVKKLMEILPEASRHIDPCPKELEGKGVINQPWSVAAAVAAETWRMSLKDLGRSTAITDTSLLVVLAAKATQRMGFQRVSPGSVHKLLTALRKAGKNAPGSLTL